MIIHMYFFFSLGARSMNLSIKISPQQTSALLLKSGVKLQS